MKPKLLLTIIALAVLTTLSLAHAQGAYTPESPTTGITTLVSVDSDGMQGDGWSGTPAISADGRYVAFCSLSNLVPDDTNGIYDIYVHDRQTGDTTRVSVASDGTQGNGTSQYPVISDDGYIVAFQSEASNLVSNDTNNKADIFVHDRQTGATTRVSVASNETQGDDDSRNPAISGDGRYVAFDSVATNLVPGDTNDFMEIYVHDRQTGQTSLVSVAYEPEEYFHSSSHPSISLGGRYVAFLSNASNLVPGDTNGYDDIFVRDTQDGVTSRVSIAYDGTQGNSSSYNPAISADGQYVAFYSAASNLVPGDINNTGDIFVHNRQNNITTLVSVASDGMQGDDSVGVFTSISAYGRYVAFTSLATNLVTSDTNGKRDVFVHDTQTGQTTRVSVASDGTQADWGSGDWGFDISGNGRYVTFDSQAINLVPNDTTFASDVFVHELEANLTINYPDGAPGSYFTVTGSRFPANATATISANGHELGTVPVDAIGGFSFIFSTTNADEGIYMITASVNPSATTQLILDTAEPIRPQEGTGSIIDIPGGIAFTNQIFLPLLQR